MDGWSVNTLGHCIPPISSSYPWCNTRPHRGCQDFYRNCSLLHLCACVCGVSVPPRPGNLFQTLSCSPRPCSISHHLLDNLRKQRSENRQRGFMRPFWWKCWQYLLALKYSDLCHILGRRTAAIFSTCVWWSTRLLCGWRQDFCRSCARQRPCTCSCCTCTVCDCEALGPTTSDMLVQKLSLKRFPHNLGQINHPRPHSDSLVN